MAFSSALVHYKTWQPAKWQKHFCGIAMKSVCSITTACAKENSDWREERSHSCTPGQSQFTPKDPTFLSNWTQVFITHALRWCTRTYSGSREKDYLDKCRKHKPAPTLLQDTNPAGKGISENACTQVLLPRSCIRDSKNWLMNAEKILRK